MAKPHSPASLQRQPTLRWPWLLLSAGCLIVGCLYLGFGNWTSAQRVETAPTKNASENTLTSQGEDSVIAE